MFQNDNGSVVKHLAKKSFKVNKTRNLFVIMAIALTTFLISSVFSIGISYYDTYKLQQTRIMGTTTHAALTNPSDKQINSLKNATLAGNIKNVGVSHRIGSVDTREIKDILVGLSWLDETEWQEHRIPSISGIVGSYPKEKNEIMAPTWVLEKMGITKPKVGMSIKMSYFLETSGNSKSKAYKTGEFILSGYFKDYSNIRTNNRGSILVSKTFRDSAGISFENGGAAMLVFDDSENVSGYCEILKDKISLAEGQDFQIVPTYQQKNDSLIITIAAIVMLIMLSGYLLIYNILYISVSKDIRFYGLLKTIGTKKKQIKRMVRLQVLRLSCIGIPVGLVLAAFLSFLVVPQVLNIMYSDTANAGFKISFSSLIFMGAALFSLLTTIISCAKPAKIAGNISPIKAINFTGVKASESKIKRSVNGNKLHYMAWRNIFRNKKSAFLVFVSLFIGMTTYLLATGLISSLSPENFVKNNGGESDFVVSFNNMTMGMPIDEKIADEMKTINGVTDVRITTAAPRIEGELGSSASLVTYDPKIFFKFINSFVNNPEIKKDIDFTDPEVIASYIEDFSGYIYGIDSRYVEELNKKLDFPIDLDKFEKGEIVLLKEVSGADGSCVFPVGEQIMVKSSTSQQQFTYTIAGGFLDKDFQSNEDMRGNAPNMFISKTAMDQFAPKNRIFRVALQTDGKDDAQILNQLKSITAVNSDITIESRYEKVIQIQEYLVTVKVLSVGFTAMLFLIGIMNFINTMYVGVMVRKHEFAVMESIGMTKSQVKKMLLFEGLGYATISTLLVTVIGSELLMFLFDGLKKVSGYAVFKYPTIPMVIAIGTIFVICMQVPIITYRSMLSHSVVERLREAE